VIGTGFIGTVHVQALRRLGVQVRGVLGSSPERGAARAAEIGVTHAYATLDDCWPMTASTWSMSPRPTTPITSR
jgi:predicted dehydrogenase